MSSRLALSVAAHLQSEILLVDEVLSVGDAEFQNKSLGKLGDVAKQGRTVLFVSHKMGTINGLCSRALWIDDTRVRLDGAPQATVERYFITAGVPACFLTDGAPSAIVRFDEPFQLQVAYQVLRPTAEPVILLLGRYFVSIGTFVWLED